MPHSGWKILVVISFVKVYFFHCQSLYIIYITRGTCGSVEFILRWTVPHKFWWETNTLNKKNRMWTQNALWPFLVCFCSGPVHLAHLASAPGAHDYTIDPLTFWVSSVQTIHLWALQLSEPSQPQCCEWQLVQHCNLSGNEILTATS